MDKGNGQEKKLAMKNERGFVNLGSHPSNDIVIEGEHILPFHMMLDTRQEPYKLLPLSPSAKIWLNDKPIGGRDPVSFGAADTIHVSGLILKVQPPLNGGDSSPSLSIIDNRMESGVAEKGYLQTEAPQAAATTTPPVILSLKPGEDYQDDLILASLDQNQQTIDVEQSAVFRLTLTNGSPIVSTFNIQVEGVPEAWVVVSPQNVNLNEGARAQALITITPPRKTTSKAGNHLVRVIVKSFNHPGRQTLLHANLEINPYYDFSIGEISPNYKNIPFFNPVGEVKMEVANQGNSPAAFQLSARDEEEKCRFQFVGEGGLKETGQVSLTIPPGERMNVPVFISPLKKLFVAWRAPRHPYRVSVSQPQNASLSLFTIGTAITRPLIGLLEIILLVCFMVALTGYLFTPRINTFAIEDHAIGEGGSTSLSWKVPFLTHSLSITGLDDAIKGAQGSLMIYPSQTVNTYTLNATTWLWNLLGLQPVTRSVTVLVVPSEPTIETFTVSDTANVLHGDTDHLRWSVKNASKVQLTINGVTEVLEDPASFNGERDLEVTQDTLIYLEAFNSLSSTARAIYFNANPPGIKINRFETSKSTIYKGDPITIYWDVNGAGMDDGGEVTISGFDGVLPNEGELTFFPTESMEFVLTVRNRTLRETRILPVGVLEPADPPVAPTIDFFTAAPDTVTGESDVELSWSVSGLVDTVSLKNSDDVIEDSMNAQGFKTITVSQSGTYLLTASYLGKVTGSNLQITVNPEMVPPKLEITSVFPDTNLQMGDTSTVNVTATQPAAGDPPPTGTIIVTDSSTSCNITLPETSCDLVFQSAGTKTITATYQGDDNYTSGEVVYDKAIIVSGIAVTLDAALKNPDQTTQAVYEYGETLDLVTSINGVKSTFTPDGIMSVKLYYCDDNQLNCAEAPDQPNETSHELTAGENGAYTFVDLITLERTTGSYLLVVKYSNDSFYNTVTKDIYFAVDSSTLSPVSITTEESTTTQYYFTITVTDENEFGHYSSPAGTVTMTATHTDGTSVTCKDVVLTQNADKRTSTTYCTLSPTKKGQYSISTTYTPTANTPHKSLTKTTGSFNATADVYIAIDPASPTLYTGLDSQMVIDISDSLGAAVTTGTLEYTYNGSTSGCTSTGDTWICNTITPVENMNLAIIFNFKPSTADEAYLSSQVKTFYNLVNKPGTIVSGLTAVNPAIAVPPYIPAVAYQFQVTVTSSQSGGDPPTSGTVNTKLVSGTGSCTDTSTREFDLPITSAGKATGFITFQDSDSGMLFCYRYAGNDGYLASNWVSEYMDTRQLEVTVSNLRISGTYTPTPPPYLPGTTYQFTATISSPETSGALPGSGQIEVKLVDPVNTCEVASTRTFTLAVSDGGAVSGSMTFLDTDEAINRVCYRYGGNTNFAVSAWNSVDLDIRKLTTIVGYLNFTASGYGTPPPYLPTVNYTLSTTINVEKNDTLTNGQVNGKLIASGGNCDTDTSTRTFTMMLGANNSATGNFAFQDSDNGLTLCYQYSGDDGHATSAWASLTGLNVAGYATTVGSLSVNNPPISVPPYIPGVDYQFRASVMSPETSTAPSAGEVEIKIVSGLDCTVASTRNYTLSVGTGGAASGNVTFQSSDNGLTVCYRYGGYGVYEESSWSSTMYTVRKINTVVSTAGYSDSGSFPPSSFTVGRSYTFNATVNETDGKGTTIPSGGTVTLTLAPATGTCSATTTLFSSSYSMTVGSSGIATVSGVTFPNTLSSTTEYMLCYRYNESTYYATSPWYSINNVYISMRSSTASSLATAPTTSTVYTAGASYPFTATVTDTLGDSAYVPTGGTLNMYLVDHTVTATSGCTTSTLAGTLAVNNGTASGNITFTTAMATGSSHKICYRYSGDSNHSASAWVLVDAAFYIKVQPTFSMQPASATVYASEDLTIPLTYSTTLSLTMSTVQTVAASSFTLMNGTATVCSGSEHTTSTYACSAGSVVNGSGTATVTWNIAYDSPQSMTLTPTFTTDTAHLSLTGTAFTLTSVYNVTWSSASWNDSSSTNDVIAYFAGEPDNMTTSFTGVIGLTNFTSFTQFDTLGLTAAITPSSSINGGSCTVDNTDNSANNVTGTIACTGVGITAASLETVNIGLTPSTAANFSTDGLTSGNIAIDVKGNQIEQEGADPVVSIGCKVDNTMQFTVTGRATLGQTSLSADSNAEAKNFQILLGCEENNGTGRFWKVYNTRSFNSSYPQNATLSAFNYDESNGDYTLLVDTSDDGCGFSADYLMVGLYFGYQPPLTIADGSYSEAATNANNFQTTSVFANSIVDSAYEFFYDISQQYGVGNTIFRKCSDGGIDTTNFTWTWN